MAVVSGSADFSRKEGVDECRLAQARFTWVLGHFGAWTAKNTKGTEGGVTARTDNHDGQVSTTLADYLVPLYGVSSSLDGYCTRRGT